MTRFIALTALLATCGSPAGLDDPRFATGSTSMVTAKEGPVLYAVNVDEGSLSRLDADAGDLSEVDLGAEPIRVARVGDELWVTLRGERSVAIVVDQDGELVVDGRIDVGAEPFGIVATENGKRVYVAVSQEGQVIEFHGRKRSEERRFDVMHDARWLALHPADRILYVAGPYGDRIAFIDLEEGTVATKEQPGATRPTEDGVIDLLGRFTGDPAITPDGDRVGFPMLYVDNDTSVDVPDDDRPSRDGYGSSGIDVSRMNPSLWELELDPETGIPETGDNDESLVFLADSLVSHDERRSTIIRSFPSAVQAHPSGAEWVVSFEGSAAVAAVSLRGDSGVGGGGKDIAVADTATMVPGEVGDEFFRGNTNPTANGFVLRSIRMAGTQVGPSSVAFLDTEDAAYLHSWLDRSVSRLPMDDMVDGLDGEGFQPTPEAFAGRRLTDSALATEVEEGRRLFFSAIDPRMAGAGAGVSCSTCHFDGRNDGLTWTLDGQPRQTPSLAGPVQDTAPFTWSDEVASVADEAMLTTSLRMGGGLELHDAELVQAYVEWSRLPDTARGNAAQIKRGKALFERADVGCASCHSGDAATDNGFHLLYGDLPTQTPTLRGIAATAPYLHDGSAETLMDLLERVRDGSMGNTSSLSDGEMEDLEAYLKSL